jgi:hypothetical protein
MNEQVQSFQLSPNPDPHHYRVILYALGALFLIIIGGGVGFLLGIWQQQQQSVILSPTPISSSSQVPTSAISPSTTVIHLPSPTIFKGSWFLTLTSDNRYKRSPAELLVTDENGNQTGYLVSNGKIVQNIYGTSFCICQGISDPSGKLPPSPNVPSFDDDAPTAGVYKVQVLGISSGTYILYFSSSAGGPLSQAEVKGTASPGSIDTYQVTCTSTCSPPTKI